MTKSLLMFYGIGVAVTAMALLRPQDHRHGSVINIASILLWPFYWTFFLVVILLNRKSS